MNKGLTAVDLSGNELTDKAAAALAESLSRPDATLQVGPCGWAAT